MVMWKAKVWPQGVIWGHKGSVPKEIRHCTLLPVIIITCHKQEDGKVRECLLFGMFCIYPWVSANKTYLSRFA